MFCVTLPESPMLNKNSSNAFIPIILEHKIIENKARNLMNYIKVRCIEKSFETALY